MPPAPMPVDIPTGRVDAAAEALIREAEARRRLRRRRQAIVLPLVLGVVAAGLAGYRSLGSNAPSTPAASAPVAAKIATAWRTAGLTTWKHGEPGNYLGAGPSSTITCAGGSGPSCYVVVQANGYQPDGSPTVAGVVPGLSPYRSTAYRSTDGGTTWKELTIPPATWFSTPFACAGPSVCAVGAVIGAGQSPAVSGTDVVLTTADGGRTWARHPLPGWIGLVTQLACPSSADCVALAWARGAPEIDGLQPYAGYDRFYPTSVLTTDDGGRSWSRSALPPEAPHVSLYLSSLSCPTVDRCLFLGQRSTIIPVDGSYRIGDDTGLVLSSDDGGQVVTTSDRPSGIPVAAVCAASSSCQVIVATNLGRSWLVLTGGPRGPWVTAPRTGFPAPLELEGGPISLSCPSPGHCLVTGPTGVATTIDGGRHWAYTDSVPPVQATYGFNLLGPSSCVQSGVCLVLDDMFPPATSFGPDTTRVLTNAAGR
jgi:hypothetical protein